MYNERQQSSPRIPKPSTLQMPENPYQSSQVADFNSMAENLAGHAKNNNREDPNSLLGIARQTFLAWEKLRLIYIGILGAFCLAVVAINGWLSIGMLIALVAGGLFANLCYFAGPLIETYVRWLGYHGHALRWGLFVSGTLLTALLAIAALISLLR